MIKTSSDLCGSLRQSSEIFGNFLGKMFGIIRVAFEQCLQNLRKSSESGRKSLDNRQKCLYNKKKITCLLGDTNFSCHVEKSFSTLEQKFHISTQPCNIFYVWINSYHASAQARSLGNTGRSSRYLRPFCRTVNTHCYSVSKGT